MTYWLHKMKRDRFVEEDRLAVLSALAGRFQRTVVTEAKRLFATVEQELPAVLSQVDCSEPRRTTFDELAMCLRDLDPEDPDRNRYFSLLKCALSGVISGQVRKLLEAAQGSTNGPVQESRDRTGMRMAFGSDTEATLMIVAEKAVEARRWEKRFVYAHRSASVMFPAAAAAGLALIFPILFNATWAWWVSVGLLSGFGLSAIAALACLVVVYRSRDWFQDAGSRYRQEEFWQTEIVRHRAR
jgi:hypothetical protein